MAAGEGEVGQRDRAAERAAEKLQARLDGFAKLVRWIGCRPQVEGHAGGLAVRVLDRQEPQTGPRFQHARVELAVVVAGDDSAPIARTRDRHPVLRRSPGSPCNPAVARHVNLIRVGGAPRASDEAFTVGGAGDAGPVAVGIPRGPSYAVVTGNVDSSAVLDRGELAAVGGRSHVAPLALFVSVRPRFAVVVGDDETIGRGRAACGRDPSGSVIRASHAIPRAVAFNRSPRPAVVGGAVKRIVERCGNEVSRVGRRGDHHPIAGGIARLPGLTEVPGDVDRSAVDNAQERSAVGRGSHAAPVQRIGGRGPGRAGVRRNIEGIA